MSRTMTIEDMKELIQKGKSAGEDPLAVVTGMFAGLGQNVSVTGEVLLKALKESKVPLPKEAAEILGSVQTLEKDGDDVKLVFAEQLQPVVRGTQLRLGPTIAATLQKFPDGVALAEITGISVNKFVWIDVQRVQFHDNDGKRSVKVDTNFGGKEFKLP
jgi:hypothetical protein